MRKITYLIFMVSLFALGGCEDILNTEAKDAFTEDFIYSDADQTESALFTVYNSTESWGLNRYNWWAQRFNIEAASYEARFNFNDIDQFRLISGMTSSNGGGVFIDKWRNYWDYVRLANEFLDRIDASEAMKSDPDRVNIQKAEMRFLRANIYSKLIAYYGGVTIMEHALGLDDDFTIVRNSYEECVAFIAKELTEVAEVLPENRPANEFGRATKMAALAVKSRTLLYAASKLHDPTTAPSDNPLWVYTKSTKWQDASDAAKAIIEIVVERDLLKVADAGEYQKMFLEPNEDVLFARPFGKEYYDFGTVANTLPDMFQSPNGYGGWALCSPTHNFALQFNMADGNTTEEMYYDPMDPNTGREMRYYANLNFNGTQFRGRDVQYWLQLDADGEVDESKVQGLDSPMGAGNVKHSSKTGYNIRKFQDESIPVGGISPKRPFILYRLAEVYLNYAEAQYHLGNEDEARKFVSKVSTRALQPAIISSGDELLEAIKRERRVELCFEGHNFFDERRWMEKEHLGYDIKGLKWTKDINGVVMPNEVTVITQPYFEKHYYLPIPASEVEKAPTLYQNYLY